MIITILAGDVLDHLKELPDCSVHCCVTSPPYWGLRDYGTGQWEGGNPNCKHDLTAARNGRGGSGPNSKNTAGSYPSEFPAGVCSKCGAKYADCQIGLEKTPEEYVAKMVEVFREVKRVLRDDGTLWLNLGDSYWTDSPIRESSAEAFSKEWDISQTASRGGKRKTAARHGVFKNKDLVGIPWMVAFALRADGWYLRSDIIWSKPNPMPESVTDRPTKAHEYIFLLTKNARYYYDADAVREKYLDSSIERLKQGFNMNGLNPAALATKNPSVKAQGIIEPNPAGRNRRTVWEIATQPTPEAHFATFPEALVEPCIKAGTSERGCCPVCGSPWERIMERGEPLEEQKKACGADSNGGYGGQSEKYLKQDALGKATYTGFNARWKEKQQNASDVKRRILDGMRERIYDWQPTCSCGNEDTVPCTVLDPFGGSGTTGLVARNLKRDAILIELNPAYVKIMRKKLRLYEQLAV